jgi:hypothetical protein
LIQLPHLTPSFWGTFGRRVRFGVVTEHEKSEEYREMAAECLQLAKRTSAPADSAFLLDLAFRWHMLAQNMSVDLQKAEDAAPRPDGGSSSPLH